MGDILKEKHCSYYIVPGRALKHLNCRTKNDPDIGFVRQELQPRHITFPIQ